MSTAALPTLRAGSIVEITRNDVALRFVVHRPCAARVTCLQGNGLVLVIQHHEEEVKFGGKPVGVRVVSGPPQWN